MKESAYILKLRQKAQKILDEDPKRFDTLDKEAVKKLYHELQVHQIELEIQNEELRNIQNTMEANRLRYTSLFDSAPVGYVLLDKSGIIKQFNRAFYKFVKNNKMITHSYAAFADLLTEESAHVFRSRFKSFVKAPEMRSLEAEISDGQGGVYYVLIRLASHTQPKYNQGILPEELLVSITDISELKQVKSELQQSLDRISQLSGLVPICSKCKKIRDDKGFWESIEGFIKKHSVAEFTHGMCPDCNDELYGKEDWYQDMKKNQDKN